MLDVYKRECFYKIDDEDWEKIDSFLYDEEIVLREFDGNTIEDVIFDSVSWKALYDVLESGKYEEKGITVGTTYFTRTPYIRIVNTQFMIDSFDRISIKEVYTKKDITLSWLFETVNADEFIRYVVDRL